MGLIGKVQSALSTYFFPLRNPGFGGAQSVITSSDTQNAIEEVLNIAGASASPGFAFTRSGNVGPGAWLQNGTVPSNITGITFPFYQGKLTEVTFSNEDPATCTLGIYEHDKTTYTLLYTMTVTAQYSQVDSVSGVSVTRGKEIAVQVLTGSCKNASVQLILKGSSTP
jgi:hypothetical protein